MSQIDQSRPAHRADMKTRELTPLVQQKLDHVRQLAKRPQPRHRADAPVDWFPSPTLNRILNEGQTS